MRSRASGSRSIRNSCAKMNNPCPTKANDCTCDPNPITNFSSELLEELTYRAIAWDLPDTRINGGGPPVIPGIGVPPGFCQSVHTLEAAWFCARRISFITDLGSYTGLPLYYNALAVCTTYCPDGLPFTIQVGPGMIVGLSQYAVDQQAAAVACQLATSRRICMSSIVGKTCVGAGYSEVITATAPTNCTFTLVAGTLPPGVTLTILDGHHASLAGVPNTPGVYPFTIRATSATTNYMQKMYIISVQGITNPGSLPDGTENTPYSETLAGIGGTAPYSFYAVSGAPPPGITLSLAGVLSGTPTASGDYTFTIAVTDSSP